MAYIGFGITIVLEHITYGGGDAAFYLVCVSISDLSDPEHLRFKTTRHHLCNPHTEHTAWSPTFVG
jgi:hypothetical protein